MADEPTCGKGLAEHSALPAKLAELIGSVADNLEIHMKALDPSDANAIKERDAYESLTRQKRWSSSRPCWNRRRACSPMRGREAVS